jgi:hypothetical protein
MEVPNLPVNNNQDLDKLFEHLPIELDKKVELPSNGKFYKNSTGIKIRPMNLEDEKAIALAKGKVDDPINIVLSRCVEGVDIDELLILDKLALIFNLRAISYGDIYKCIGICMECNAENDMNVPLLSLPLEKIGDDVSDPREIELPVLKKKVKVIFPRVVHEQYINTKEKVFDNLWRFVISVDGTTDKTLISKFLSDPRLPLKDVHTIINCITGIGYGVQTKVKFECQSCKTHNVIDLPLGADFFTVK